MVSIQQYPSLIPGEQRALYTKKKPQRHKIFSVLNNCKRCCRGYTIHHWHVLPATTKRSLLKPGWSQLPFSDPGLGGYSLTWTARILLSTCCHELQQHSTCWNQPQPQSEHQSHSSTRELTQPWRWDPRAAGRGRQGTAQLCVHEMGLCASPTASPTGDIHPPCRGAASRPEKASFSKSDRKQGIRES